MAGFMTGGTANSRSIAERIAVHLRFACMRHLISTRSDAVKRLCQPSFRAPKHINPSTQKNKRADDQLPVVPAAVIHYNL